jgi:hypothetical protein
MTGARKVWVCINQCPKCRTLGDYSEFPRGDCPESSGVCQYRGRPHQHLDCPDCGTAWRQESQED